MDKYVGDHYGVMLYNLYDESSQKYFRCWGTLTKLCWDVPRGTHKYFVPNLLTAGHTSIRTNLVGRYVNFYRSLVKSKSEEVALVANIAGRDKSSTTGINLANIQAEMGLNPWTASSMEVRLKLNEGEVQVPPTDLWRITLLQKLLAQRHNGMICKSIVRKLMNSTNSLKVSVPVRGCTKLH